MAFEPAGRYYWYMSWATPEDVGDAGGVGPGLLGQVRRELDDVEVALRRLEEGTYAICEACGQPIGQSFLVTAPAARYCEGHRPVEDVGRGPG